MPRTITATSEIYHYYTIPDEIDLDEVEYWAKDGVLYIELESGEIIEIPNDGSDIDRDATHYEVSECP